jgi:hypothetical protein
VNASELERLESERERDTIPAPAEAPAAEQLELTEVRFRDHERRIALLEAMIFGDGK